MAALRGAVRSSMNRTSGPCPARVPFQDTMIATLPRLPATMQTALYPPTHFKPPAAEEKKKKKRERSSMEARSLIHDGADSGDDFSGPPRL